MTWGWHLPIVNKENLEQFFEALLTTLRDGYSVLTQRDELAMVFSVPKPFYQYFICYPKPIIIIGL